MNGFVRAPYPGTCDRCGEDFATGDTVQVVGDNVATAQTYCEDCADDDSEGH